MAERDEILKKQGLVRGGIIAIQHMPNETPEYGVILNALTKEETTEVGSWGQMVQCLNLSNGLVQDHNDDYELVANPSDGIQKRAKDMLMRYDFEQAVDKLSISDFHYSDARKTGCLILPYDIAKYLESKSDVQKGECMIYQSLDWRHEYGMNLHNHPEEPFVVVDRNDDTFTMYTKVTGMTVDALEMSDEVVIDMQPLVDKLQVLYDERQANKQVVQELLENGQVAIDWTGNLGGKDCFKLCHSSNNKPFVSSDGYDCSVYVPSIAGDAGQSEAIADAIMQKYPTFIDLREQQEKEVYRGQQSKRMANLDAKFGDIIEKDRVLNGLNGHEYADDFGGYEG